ncbi:MAG: T9SS type A sorting domain-containing protein [Calditrichaeota bacterium]|nr:T9SS type A sorting domain-containing protein [Calditrichota bacterium]
MKHILFALALLGILILTQPSEGVNYFWLTDSECGLPYHPLPGQACVRSRFFGSDTIWGVIRSNDCISSQNVNGLPVFYDCIISSAPSFCGGSPNPPGVFLGCDPVFNAPEIVFPDQAVYLRDEAAMQGHFFSMPGMEWRGELSGNVLNLYYFEEGTLFDSLFLPPFLQINLTGVPAPVVFVDGKLDLEGTVTATGAHLWIGASDDIRLTDNVMLQGTNSVNGALPDAAYEPNGSKLVIVSEGNVVIANTWENGRDNRAQGSDIVITALIFALGNSFTFEQQNDTQELYVSPSFPDERGSIVLTGAITQRNRGFLHRSNNGGTGYNKVFHWDSRMTNWWNGVFSPRYDEDLPDTLYFEDTPVGAVAQDTLTLNSGGAFSGAWTTAPFSTTQFYQYPGPYSVPVSFAPQFVGPAYGTLFFYLDGQYTSVALRGNGLPAGGPQAVETEVYPNPFNATSNLRFVLPEAGHVRAIVYDVLGREVTRLADQAFLAGEHQLSIGAGNWSSGLYFLRIETPGQIQTQKLMLIK